MLKCPVYGPVPSRRLGRSLGIDLVPYKTCTYDCIYCQLGRTRNQTLERREYVPVRRILKDLERKLAEGVAPDYISLAGSGEPTLNSGIGRIIRNIKKKTRISVAVLTNGSLLWDRRVQEELMGADLVIPSLDAGDGFLFDYVNRPHGHIQFGRMVEGIAEFTSRFPGSVWLEVFLLGGVTGLPPEARKIAEWVRRIRPERTQLNTVQRPPAEDFALAVPERRMRELSRLFPKPTDVIVGSPRKSKKTPSLYAADSADILALVKRRPCTLHDIANGLSVSPNEVLKMMGSLLSSGRVNRSRREDGDYYTVGDPPRSRKATR